MTIFIDSSSFILFEEKYFKWLKEKEKKEKTKIDKFKSFVNNTVLFKHRRKDSFDKMLNSWWERLTCHTFRDLLSTNTIKVRYKWRSQSLSSHDLRTLPRVLMKSNESSAEKLRRSTAEITVITRGVSGVWPLGGWTLVARRANRDGPRRSRTAGNAERFAQRLL